ADDAGRGGPRLAAPRHRDAGFPDDHRDAVHVLHRQRHHARDRLVRARPGPHRARPRRPPPPLRPRRRAPPLLRDHRLLTMPTDRLTDLKNRLALVQDLRASAAVLEWDQETYMPPGAAEARAHQLATLKTLAHRRFTDESVGALLDGLDGLVEDEFDRALVRVTRRDFERATKLSADLVARLARAKARALEAWKRARQNDDFAHFAPHLREIVDLSIEQAEALGHERRRYDALLDEYEPEAAWAK